MCVCGGGGIGVPIDGFVTKTVKMGYTKLTFFKEEIEREMVQHLDASPWVTRMHKQVHSDGTAWK